MQNRNNLKSLIRQELVERFEQVVKDEINRHNSAILVYQNEISELRKLFDDHKKILINWKENSHKDFDKAQENFIETAVKLEKKHRDQDAFLTEKGKQFSEVLQEHQSSLNHFALKEELLKLKEEIKEELKIFSSEMFEERKKHRDDILNQQKKLEEKVERECDKFNKVVYSCVEDMNKFSDKLSVNIVDAQGITRMIKIDQKALFIVEKKIENIYTLIQRLTNKIDSRG